jgi:hypothetical protein
MRPEEAMVAEIFQLPIPGVQVLRRCGAPTARFPARFGDRRGPRPHAPRAMKSKSYQVGASKGGIRQIRPERQASYLGNIGAPSHLRGTDPK